MRADRLQSDDDILEQTRAQGLRLLGELVSDERDLEEHRARTGQAHDAPIGPVIEAVRRLLADLEHGENP